MKLFNLITREDEHALHTLQSDILQILLVMNFAQPPIFTGT